MRLLLAIPVGLAVALAAGCTTDQAAEPASAEPETTTAAAPDPHGHDHGANATPAESAAATTAEAFLAAYLDADLAGADFDAWLAALDPHTHGPYLESLAVADPDNLFADTLDAPLAAVATDREDTAAFEAVGASGALWRVELFAGDGRWLVYSVAREAAP